MIEITVRENYVYVSFGKGTLTLLNEKLGRLRQDRTVLRHQDDPYQMEHDNTYAEGDLMKAWDAYRTYQAAGQTLADKPESIADIMRRLVNGAEWDAQRYQQQDAERRVWEEYHQRNAQKKADALDEGLKWKTLAEIQEKLGIKE